MRSPAADQAPGSSPAGRVWRRWAWPAALAAVWALAAALRLALLDGPLYGDESAHYAVARGWGDDPDNVTPAYALNEALWWQRPLFSVLLWPGAALGLAAYRVEHALLAALLPVLAAEVARKAGAGPVLALGAGLALAVHPDLVLWGSRVFPDSIMAALVLGGIRAHQSQRPLAAAGLLLAAVWTKETAFVALASLLAWSLWTGRRSGTVDLWPLRLDRRATALLGAALLAPLPLAHAVINVGGRVPGWSTTPLAAAHLDGLFLTAWLLVPIAAGLAWRRSRPYALAALAYPAFYVAYGSLGHGVERWYLVLPAALAALAAAVALGEAARQAAPSVRAAGRGVAAALAVLLLATALVPDTLAPKQAVAPASPPAASLGQLGAALRGDPLEDAVAAVREGQWGVVFLVDVPWFHVHHPFAERAGAVGWSYTGVSIPLAEWAHAVEGSDVTVLLKVDRPFNLALREAYADCVQHEDAQYVLLEGPRCPDRLEALREALARHGG